MNAPKVKVLLVVIGAIALSALGGWAYFSRQNRLEYRTARVERGDIEATVSATGNLNAVITVQVGSQVSGNIMELHADFNTKVKKGQLVARIDPAVFEAKVSQAAANRDNASAGVLNARAMLQRNEAEIANAKASLEAAKANVAKAKVGVYDAQIKLKSRTDLFKEGGISAEERNSAQAAYDSNVSAVEASQAQEQAAQFTIRAAEAQLEVARAQLASAEAQVKQYTAALKQAQVDLDHTYIRAPVDGTVVSRNVDVGQTVAATLQAPTLFLIAQDLTKMQVDTNVDEADIGRIVMGQQASFTVDAYPSETFKGKVVQIRQAPINIQNVITYNVVITVPNPDLKLFPGMTANVMVHVDRRDNILKISNAALRFRPPDLKERPPPGGDGAPRAATGPPTGEGPAGVRGNRETVVQQTIWVLGDDGRPRPVTVKLGVTDGSFSEVTEGDLSEGQKVVVGVDSSKGSSAGEQTRPFGLRGGRF